MRIGDFDIARIGLGTNRLRNTDENVEFIRAAVEAGVQLIDTAHLYTGGESEQTIGRALSPVPRGCLIATKGGYAPGHGSPKVLRREIEESLTRLRTDRIGLYYLHRVDPETPIEDSLGMIKTFVDRGLIQHVGLSQVDAPLIERAQKVVPIAAVQNHYNLAERRYDGVVDFCARQGIAFVPYFPLQVEVTAPVERIARRHGATPTQILLAWLLARSPGVVPIPGTLSLAHVKENLGALGLELSDEERTALAADGGRPGAPGPG